MAAQRLGPVCLGRQSVTGPTVQACYAMPTERTFDQAALASSLVVK